MRYFYAFLIALFIGNFSFGQITENFDTGLSTSYTTGNQVLSSGTWTTVAVTQEISSNSRSGFAARINDDVSGAHLTTPPLNGVGTVTFWYRELNAGGGTFQLQKSTDGTNYTTIDSQAFSGTTYAQYTFNVNDSSSNLTLRILNDDQLGHLIVDDFSTTAPVISCSGQPSVQATDLSFSNQTDTTIDVSWTAGIGGDSYILVMNEGSAVTFEPTDDSDYTSDTGSGDFSAAVDQGSGNKIVFDGSGTSTTVSGLSATTTYFFQVFHYCENSGTEDYIITDGTGNDGSQNTDTTAVTYCSGGPTNNADSEIENVSLDGVGSGDINNDTTDVCTGGTGGVINDFTAQTADLEQNGTYTVSVEFGDCDNGTQYDGAGGVWIDWNADGDFDDANEEIGTADVAVSGGNVTEDFTINVPAGQQIGSFRMRIVQEESGASGTISPCGTFTYGSIEDYTVNVIASTSNSSESDIIAITFTPTDNIDYTSFFATSSLTTSNAVKVGEFEIRDGGSGNDSDNVGTILTELSFDVLGNTNLAALAIFDGSSNVSEITSISPNSTFSGLSLTAADDNSKTFDVYATFASTVTDNEVIQLTISSATADGLNGSVFSTLDASGASTPTSGDNNRIEVTASDLIFDQDVSDVQISLVMNPSPTVQAVDGNVNLDLDFTGSVSLAVTSGTTTIDATATASVNAVGGIATFNNLIFDTVASGNVFTASATSLTDGSSSSFDVTAAPTFGWQITSTNTDFTIDFDATVAGVNNGQFAGTGFTPTPAVGQLNSDAWESTGMSDGALSYSGSQTSGDYAKGPSTGGETAGGFFAFDTGSGNNSLGFQGTSSDFTPGTLTLRAQNQTGVTVTAVDIGYLIYVYNNEGRANSLNFSYSTDDITYTNVSSLDFTSTETADGSPSWVSNSRSTSLNGLSISDGGYLYLRWFSDDVSGSGSRDEFALDDITLSFLTPTTYTYNGSWSPTDPNGSAISIDVIEVLSGSASVTSNLSVNTVSISSGATLTVNSGQSLTTASDLNNSGTLVLNSTSTQYSSLIVNGTATGDVTYNRYTAMIAIAPTGTNDLIASPVSGQQFGAFATVNDDVLSESGDIRAFAPFNTVTGNYENYDVVTNALTTITPGIGYRAATDSGQTLAFTGTPNNGAVAVSLQDNTSFWNLIGNPYPSYIDIGDFLAENVATTNINTSFYGVYGYDGDVTNGWTVWDLNVNQDLLIAPGQGFFVAAPSGGGSGINFTTAMRRSGTSDDFIAERNTTSDANFAHAILNLNTASTTYVTNLYFRDINTLGLDPGYDTGAFDQTANGIYSHLVADNTGVALANQSLPFTSLSDQSIPLVVNANAGEQLTFSLNTNSNIPDNINIYLEDQLAGSVTLLNSSAYVLTPASNLSGPGRFYLRFTDNALNVNQQDLSTINLYTVDKELIIAGFLQHRTTATIFDIQGRAILSVPLDVFSQLQKIDMRPFTTGIYIVQLTNNITALSQKIILK